ncbi:hypothetical protein GCM10010254_35810 [Streptomyces chromofuscus]|nr:hypothetical protein GCM10010254_35810 [Streptomyces chromofuscus]
MDEQGLARPDTERPQLGGDGVTGHKGRSEGVWAWSGSVPDGPRRGRRNFRAVIDQRSFSQVGLGLPK